MADINAGVEKYRATPGAVLLDVRAAQEYRQGHIPSSVNLPLDRIGQADMYFEDRDTPLFVYCYSGARSAQAAAALKSMGYANVVNIGGIADYRGATE